MRFDPLRVAQILREVADEHIIPYFQHLTREQIAFKIGDDPVTIADKKTESALSARLLDLLPGSKVVGEEDFASNRDSLNQFYGESPVWIIDPIDGTRNFVKGSSDFGSIVALAEQNQTIAGWIYHPTSKEVVTTEKGSGAYYRGQKLKVRRGVPSHEMRGFLGDYLIAEHDASSKGKEPNFEIMRAGAVEYPRLILDAPHFGSDRPQMDFRASKVHSTPWDDAAGVLMHQEAGGYSAFWNGDAYRPSIMDRGFALAPDKDSWHDLKAWIAGFVDLPS